MSLWHCLINVFMCVPLIYTCARVILRQNEARVSIFDQASQTKANPKLQLLATHFKPTQDEDDAYLAACVMLCAPPIFVIAAWAEFKIIEVYYKSGHPWARIFNEFPCNVNAKKK